MRTATVTLLGVLSVVLVGCGPVLRLDVAANHISVDGVRQRFASEQEFADWLRAREPGRVEVRYTGRNNSYFAYRIGQIVDDVAQERGFAVDYSLVFDRDPFQAPPSAQESPP